MSKEKLKAACDVVLSDSDPLRADVVLLELTPEQCATPELVFANAARYLARHVRTTELTNSRLTKPAPVAVPTGAMYDNIDIYRTFDQWKDAGKRIKKGARACGRNSRGITVFHINDTEASLYSSPRAWAPPVPEDRSMEPRFDENDSYPTAGQ